MATDLGVCKQGAECICVSFIVVQDCDKFQSESLVSPTALVSAQNGCLRVMEPWSAAAAPQQQRRRSAATAASLGTSAKQDVACQAGSI